MGRSKRVTHCENEGICGCLSLHNGVLQGEQVMRIYTGPCFEIENLNKFADAIIEEIETLRTEIDEYGEFNDHFFLINFANNVKKHVDGLNRNLG